MLGSLLSGIAKSVPSLLLDQIFGGSRGVTNAMNARRNTLTSILGRLNRDAGANAADSLFYKTASQLIEDRYKRQRDMTRVLGAQSGATQEAQLGGMQSLNESQDSASKSALATAEGERQKLLAQGDAISREISGDDIARAREHRNTVGGYQTLLNSVMSDWSKTDAWQNFFGIGAPKQGTEV